jgi:hypothetical protein
MVIGAQQLVPQQQAVVGYQLGDLLTSIMPIVMLMMVMTKIAAHPSLRAARTDSASDGETP